MVLRYCQKCHTIARPVKQRIPPKIHHPLSFSLLLSNGVRLGEPSFEQGSLTSGVRARAHSYKLLQD